ncbi:metal-dependent hydrolase [Paenibacillus rigui]|uniref:Permease n=1 Tax=Paenibacillus rigui TaxID=554312 RepID=A0A229UNX9_9BACL|nr:metal-dependent hydrolase [Paenibacillus rigui]OXM85078.1 permease [Paenibacillus rigui]
MFAGHFGLAAIVKAKRPEVPLWALMLSTQLLDVVFVPLYLSGIETIEPVAGDGYGEAVIHADYTHSLLGALVLAAVAGWIASRWQGKRIGSVIGAVVFSHWLLDLLVHRSDLPLLPGNLGQWPLLGFELWKYPVVSIGLEVALIALGAIFYFRNVLQRAGSADGHRRSRAKTWALTSGIVMTGLLVLSLVTDVLGVG